MQEILPNLYLSSYNSAKVAAKEFEFWVVNCSKDLPFVNDGIRLSVDDDGEKSNIDMMLMMLPEITAAIHEHITLGINVVVHCLAGQQRSPTVICAYIMRYHKYNLNDAISFIRSRKRDAFFYNVNFRESLEKYEKSLLNQD